MRRVIGVTGYLKALALSIGVPLDRVNCPDRRRCVSVFRQYAMCEALSRGFTLPQVGQMFDRHHTTVMVAPAAVHRRLASFSLRDEQLAAAVIYRENLKRVAEKRA